MVIFSAKTDEESVNIEPQYDGVLMISSDAVFFNDAKARPDGQKIYHIFDQSSEVDTDVEFSRIAKEEHNDLKEELFSKASAESIYWIQQALDKNGISIQECFSISSSDAHQTIIAGIETLRNDHGHIADPFQIFDVPIWQQNVESTYVTLSIDNQHSLLLPQEMVGHSYELENLRVYKVYRFLINLLPTILNPQMQDKLVKKLERRGVFNIVIETENCHITVTTLRSAQYVLKLLRRVDKNTILLSSSQVLVDDKTYSKQSH